MTNLTMVYYSCSLLAEDPQVAKERAVKLAMGMYPSADSYDLISVGYDQATMTHDFEFEIELSSEPDEED